MWLAIFLALIYVFLQFVFYALVILGASWILISVFESLGRCKKKKDDIS